MSGSNSRYAIIIEKTATGFSAFVPDLPGCIATGIDPAEVLGEMKSAIRFHIDGLIEDRLTVPQATSIAEYVEA
jgi:predicted RNase H-like HicB family nuclease